MLGQDQDAPALSPRHRGRDSHGHLPTAVCRLFCVSEERCPVAEGVRKVPSVDYAPHRRPRRHSDTHSSHGTVPAPAPSHLSSLWAPSPAASAPPPGNVPSPSPCTLTSLRAHVPVPQVTARGGACPRGADGPWKAGVAFCSLPCLLLEDSARQARSCRSQVGREGDGRAQRLALDQLLMLAGVHWAKRHHLSVFEEPEEKVPLPGVSVSDMYVCVCVCVSARVCSCVMPVCAYMCS